MGWAVEFIAGIVTQARNTDKRTHLITQGSSKKVGTGGELRAGSAGIEGILPSFEGGAPSIPGDSRRARDQYGETQTPDGDF